MTRKVLDPGSAYRGSDMDPNGQERRVLSLATCPDIEGHRSS